FINAITERYPDWQCHALVRGESRSQACARLNDGLQTAHLHYSSTPRHAHFEEDHIVLGDIQSEHCGVSAPIITELAARGIDDFWHFASSLNFEEERKDHIRAHNIGGATNAMRLAIAIKCKRFIYVSTAYTAGELQGDIPEQIHDGIGFNNYYEETKNE